MVGGLVLVVAVLGDVNRQLPELGSVLLICAVPPKTQLVGTGFFW